jgi:glucosylglycerate synthase
MASTGSNSSVQEADVSAARADIVVALTSDNDVQTIGPVARAVRDGLARYFGSSAARIVLADAGSTDGTRDAAREIVGANALIEVVYPSPAGFVEMPYHGHPGRAAALRMGLQVALHLEAKACAFVDARLHAAEPEWIERLLGPVLTDGFDYVSPYYVRHVNEGAITKGIVYPMFRALYGVRLRQPAAGEFGCSARLVAHYLEQSFWEVDHAQVGIDLWLAVAAVCAEFRVCEAALGIRHIASRDASPDLSTTLSQVVGALFADVEARADVWQRVRRSFAIPVFGSAPAVGPEAPPLNLEGLTESFRLGYRELRDVWTWVLPPRTIVELRKLAAAAPDRFALDDHLWARIIYDFAFGYIQRVMPREHVLRSLTPLYNGWLASFIRQMHDATPDQLEERIERVCLAFEAEKRYLISRWRWPERLR